MRTPFLDFFFSIITHLGEETLFLAISILFFWCVNKREGYYILVTGLLGTVINQFEKLIFRIPRPWVIDPTFTPIDSAITEATGYSFPSGHTTATAAAMMALVITYGKKFLPIAAPAIILMGASRNYLMVHYPTDVAAAMLVGTLAALCAYGVTLLIFKILHHYENVKFFRFILQFDLKNVILRSKKP
jgi:undecaprenyl-diphosphatase